VQTRHHDWNAWTENFEDRWHNDAPNCSDSTWRRGRGTYASTYNSQPVIDWNYLLVTHAGIAAGVGRAFTRVCLFVCLVVGAVKGKRLELSTPNLVHVYSIAVTQHALTQRSKGQRSRSHGYENRHGRTVNSDARIPCTYTPLCYRRPLPVSHSEIKHPRAYVRPSTKGFFDVSEIWHVEGRGRWVMHDSMQYDPIQRQGQGHVPFKFGNSAIFNSYILRHLQWQLATDHWFLN